MHEIRRRIKNVEKRLNLGEEHKTVLLIQYGGELPPDRTVGNMTIQHVMYDGAAAENGEIETE
jgi:hypothetical protein